MKFTITEYFPKNKNNKTKMATQQSNQGVFKNLQKHII